NYCWPPFYQDDIDANGKLVPLGFPVPAGLESAVGCNPSANGNGLLPMMGDYYTDATHTTHGDWHKRTIAQITDGTSNTLAIGEQWWCDNNNQPPWQLGYSFGWAFGLSAQATCSIPLNVVPYPPTANNPPGFPGVGQPNAWIYLRGFRSLHPGGGNFVFADGSVHFLSDSISLTTYKALATISRGEVASLP